MASFNEHIEQAKRNLSFLSEANCIQPAYWDWQVTVAFYVAVHLINAHIAQTLGLSYRSHEQVDKAISPYNDLSISRLSETDYLAYSKLQGLSRRARYLINDDAKNHATNAHFTYDKHFARAIKYVDTLMCFMSNKYGVTFPKTTIKCIELNNSSISNFIITP